MLGAINNVICDESTVGPPRKSRGLRAARAVDTYVGHGRLCGQASGVVPLTPGRSRRAAAERRGAAARSAVDANHESVPKRDQPS